MAGTKVSWKLWKNTLQYWELTTFLSVAQRFNHQTTTLAKLHVKICVNLQDKFSITGANLQRKSVYRLSDDAKYEK